MPKKSRTLDTKSGPDLSHIADQLRHLARPIAELLNDPSNARSHSGRNLDLIQESLRRYGQVSPILAQDKDGSIVVRVGNARLNCAAQLGWTHIAVMVLELTEAEWDRLAVIDNRSAELAEWDDANLRVLLESIEATGDPASLVGFNDMELREIMARAEEAAKSVHVSTHDRAKPGEKSDQEAKPQSQQVPPAVAYQILVDCRDSKHQEELLIRFDKENLPCRALML